MPRPGRFSHPEREHLLAAAPPEIAEDARPYLELADSRRPQVRAHEQHQPERERAGHHGADEGAGRDVAHRQRDHCYDDRRSDHGLPARGNHPEVSVKAVVTLSAAQIWLDVTHRCLAAVQRPWLVYQRAPLPALTNWGRGGGPGSWA